LRQAAPVGRPTSSELDGNDAVTIASRLPGDQRPRPWVTGDFYRGCRWLRLRVKLAARFFPRGASRVKRTTSASGRSSAGVAPKALASVIRRTIGIPGSIRTASSTTTGIEIEDRFRQHVGRGSDRGAGSAIPPATRAALSCPAAAARPAVRNFILGEPRSWRWRCSHFAVAAADNPQSTPAPSPAWRRRRPQPAQHVRYERSLVRPV
jgi:hypothetical protein